MSNIKCLSRVPGGNHRTAPAVALLWLGAIIGAGGSLAWQMIIARALTPSEFGFFASALAVVTAISPLAGFGQYAYLIKVSGEGAVAFAEKLPNSLSFTTVSTIASCVICVFIAFAVVTNLHEFIVVLLLGFIIIATAASDLVSVKFIVEERHLALSMWNLFPHVARLVVVGLIYIFMDAPTATHFAICFALVSCLSLGIARRYIRDFTSTIKIDECKVAAAKQAPKARRFFSTLRLAWPFGIEPFIYMVYFQAAVIVISRLSGPHEAGIFAAAITMLSAAYLLPTVVYQKFLVPKFQKLRHSKKSEFFALHRSGIKLMAAFGVLASIFVAFVIPLLMPIIFGQAYRRTASLVSLLALCIPARYLATAIGSAFLDREQIRARAGCFAVAAVVVTSATALLAEDCGANAGVIGVIMGEYVLLILFLLRLRSIKFSSSDGINNEEIRKSSGTEWI